MENFKIKYRQAYEHISPKPDYLEGICDRLEKKNRQRHHRLFWIMRPAVTICTVMILLSVTLLPVAAKQIPTVYNMIEKYAPALADFVLPTVISDTSHGITMQVEAVKVEGKTVEIIVSFSDAEGSGQDLIRGKVDTYDSYHLQSYGASYGIGGCSYLGYEEEDGKAYLKIDVTTDGEFDKGKLRFSVHQLLVDCSKEERQISLDEIIKDPATKTVALNGSSGQYRQAEIVGYQIKNPGGSPLPAGEVMDIINADESLTEALTVTGVGYSDGVLRLQVCRGNSKDADRHVRAFLVDEEGNERHSDCSVMWHEEVNGETILFDEDWFRIEEDELEKIRLYGVFYISGESVKGNWEVVCELE